MRRALLVLAWACCAWACAGAARPATQPPPAPSTLVASTPTTSEPPAPSEPSATTPAIAPPTTTSSAALAAPPDPADEPIEPPDRRYTVLTLAEGAVSATHPLRVASHSSTLEDTDTTMVWEDVVHPVPAVRRAIATWAREYARAIALSWAFDLECHLALADQNAVATWCTYQEVVGRDGSTESHLVGQAMRIEGETLVPLDVVSSFVARPGFQRHATESCNAAASAMMMREADGSDGERELPTTFTQCAHALMLPGPRGLQMIYLAPTYELDTVTVEVPWRDLADGVRADGGFASFLPSVGTHEIVIAGADVLSASLELDCSVRFAVTDARPWDEILDAYLGADVHGDAGVIASGPGQGRLLLESCAPDEAALLAARDAAREVAHRLHAHAERIEAPATAEIALRQLGDPLNLRRTPGTDGPWVAWLPEGVLVAAISGSIDGTPSRRGFGAFSLVGAGGGRSGWCGGRTITWFPPDSRPDLSTLLGGLPDVEREEAARSAMVGVTPMASGLRTEFAYVVASLTTPSPSVVVGVTLRRARHAPLTTPAVYARAAGTYEHVRVVRSPPEDPYVLIGTRVPELSDGMVRWQLFAPGSPTAGWTLDAPTAQTLPEQARARLETRTFSRAHTWLASFRMPDHSLVRVRASHGVFVEERVRR